MSEPRLLIVGNPQPFHVGAHLDHAARSLGVTSKFVDVGGAFQGPWWWRKVNWWLVGHRPARIRRFGRHLIEACRQFRPRWLVVTGIAPPDWQVLQTIGGLGIRRLNYLTDDPWNPAHRAPWFMKALREYDVVFSTRRANLDDLERHGCRAAVFLPFAYSPVAHFPEGPEPHEVVRYDTDIMFAGAADRDRIEVMRNLIGSGLRVALYGGYWKRDPVCRAFALGHADLPALRKSAAGAAVCLGLVRRANRDGHCMRTFEVPAMKGCLLGEDTLEHREILGDDAESVVYFRTPEEMILRARWLVGHQGERERLAQGAHARITGGKHTYADRLKHMLREQEES
jgi:spore maturation protein CgeB